MHFYFLIGIVLNPLIKTHVASTGMVHQCNHFPPKKISNLFLSISCSFQAPPLLVSIEKWWNHHHFRLANGPMILQELIDIDVHEFLIAQHLGFLMGGQVEGEGRYGSFHTKWIDLPIVTGFGQPANGYLVKRNKHTFWVNKTRLTGWWKNQSHTSPTDQWNKYLQTANIWYFKPNNISINHPEKKLWV